MFPRTIAFSFAFAAICLLPILPVTAVPTADGLYATFDTTSGEFSVQLEFEKAPMTVANFVGLAEGSRPWVDFQEGKVSTARFYDGLKIPRVEPGFVIQFGAPSDTTVGGPGYVFNDEFHPDLNHGMVGTLSMANSGPDSNGSQAFITLAATTSTANLDRRHSVFGRVVEGLSVVTTIGETKLGGEVTINSVTLIRNGAAAQAFDETAWGLPVVKEADQSLQIYPAPQLSFFREPFTKYHFFDSPDLVNWSLFGTLSEFSSPGQSPVDVSSTTVGQPDHYYSLPAAHYVPVPISIIGKTINLTFTSSANTLELAFTGAPRSSIDYAAPLGTHDLNTVPPGAPSLGSIGAYLWIVDLHRGRLVVAMENVNPSVLFISLKFRGDGTGSFTADSEDEEDDFIITDGQFPFFGTFTISDSP